MTITKLGHCCLLLDDGKTKILTDPGTYTIEQAKSIRDVQVILITHEHADHYHVDSIKTVLANSPGAVIVTNDAVAKLLAEQGLLATVVGDAQSAAVAGAIIEGYGKEHAIIYGTMGKCENTGYFVNGKFYFPGDNFHDPGRPVEILALPTAGPWMKVGEAIDFGKKVKPRAAFPMHDGMIVPMGNTFTSTMFQNFLKEVGTEFMPLVAGESRTF